MSSINGAVPRGPSITFEEAQTVLVSLTPPARRFLAYLLSRSHHEVPFTVGIRPEELVAVGLQIADPGEDRGQLAVALLHDVTGLYGDLYTLPGQVEVAPSSRLMALLWALVSGETQFYDG